MFLERRAQAEGVGGAERVGSASDAYSEHGVIGSSGLDGGVAFTQPGRSMRPSRHGALGIPGEWTMPDRSRHMPRSRSRCDFSFGRVDNDPFSGRGARGTEGAVDSADAECRVGISLASPPSPRCPDKGANRLVVSDHQTPSDSVGWRGLA